MKPIPSRHMYSKHRPELHGVQREMLLEIPLPSAYLSSPSSQHLWSRSFLEQELSDAAGPSPMARCSGLPPAGSSRMGDMGWGGSHGCSLTKPTLMRLAPRCRTRRDFPLHHLGGIYRERLKAGVCSSVREWAGGALCVSSECTPSQKPQLPPLALHHNIPDAHILFPI